MSSLEQDNEGRIMSFADEIEQFKRDALINRLAKCTSAERDFFAKIYPNGVPSKDLESAIALCDRTITHNMRNIDGS